MFKLIPPESYSFFYFYVLMFVALTTYMRSSYVLLTSERNQRQIRFFNISLLIFVSLIIGLRPFSMYFGDMIHYGSKFESYAYADRIDEFKDYLFDIYMFYTSKIMSVESFMFSCAVMYVGLIYLACEKLFKKYAYYAFLAMVVSFSFWAYGTNGIRNGLATSMFIFAISRDKFLYKMLWIALAIGFHKTMFLPFAAYLLTFALRNPKHYFYIWFISIPLSLAAGGFWEGLFADFIEDDRSVYLTTATDDVLATTGFRWDFLLYSGAAVYAAYYFMIKKDYKDVLYRHIAGIYIIANAFWILVIRANFSNRFAYLSWFLMALVIFYPLLKKEFFPNQHKRIGIILLAYAAFTFLMNVILY